MPRYKVNISDGIYEFVEADTEQEAKKKVKAIIATGAISPFYDKLHFDYETGVRGKFERKVDEGEGGLRNIRAQLGRAESAEEQDQVLTNFVGSSGFTRNTKGQIALNPAGLEELGLPVQYRTLSDGSKMPLNTILDENDWGLRTGDLADFAGIAGPIVGAIATMSPQLRVIKGLSAAFGGRERIARMFAAGIGSVAGKAGEEALDYQEGFQLQERDELKNLFGGEFLFGSIGQGAGELFGMGFNLLLGKTAPRADLRLNRQQALGRSTVDILKFDAKLGKEATDKQIAKAIRDGQIKQFDWKGLASQATLGRKLPGRLQDISEQVLGNTRDKETAAYLRAEVDSLLENIGGENALHQKSISDAVKGSLDEQVDASLQKLRLKEKDVTLQLKSLIESVVDDAIEVGNYADAPGRSFLGRELKVNLSKARKEVIADLGKKYREVDRVFNSMVSLEGKAVGSSEYVVAANLNRVVRNTINKNIEDSKKLIQQHKDADYFWNVNNKDELDAGIVSKIEKALDTFQANVANPNVPVSLSHVRNAYSKLNTISRDTLEASTERKVILEIMRKLDDSTVDQFGNRVVNKNGPDSILTQLEIEGVNEFQAAVARNAKVGFTDPSGKVIRDVDLTVETKAVQQVNRAIEELRAVNKLAAERMAPFDSIASKKIISNAQTGAYDASEVYRVAILQGEEKTLADIFKALNQYDKYMIAAKKPGKAIAEKTLKGQIKQRLFADAFRSSTDMVDETINFTEFAKQINKFERDYPGKLDLLFTDSATGRNTADLVRNTVAQVNKINPRLKPKDMKNLVSDFTTGKGLSASDQGLAFVQGLKQLAKASEDRLRLESNRAISDLPLKGIDETVSIIFRPNANSNIEILKKTVSPEVFTSIQQASMQKLLSKSIDLNGKGRITDLFKSGNLKTALDSYGDETLNAMFGKDLTQGLRNFQRTIDVLTKQEAGRGGAAGGLVAAGIGASLALNPIAVLPTVLSLAVARKLFASPRFVAAASKTDKGSILTALDMTEQAIRQVAVRQLGMGGDKAAQFSRDVMSGVIDAAGVEELISESKQLLKKGVTQGVDVFEDIEDQTQKSFQSSQATSPQIEMPEIQSFTPSQPNDPTRADFDEQLFGRPSRIG